MSQSQGIERARSEPLGEVTWANVVRVGNVRLAAQLEETRKQVGIDDSKWREFTQALELVTNNPARAHSHEPRPVRPPMVSGRRDFSPPRMRAQLDDDDVKHGPPPPPRTWKSDRGRKHASQNLAAAMRAAAIGLNPVRVSAEEGKAREVSTSNAGTPTSSTAVPAPVEVRHATDVLPVVTTQVASTARVSPTPAQSPGMEPVTPPQSVCAVRPLDQAPVQMLHSPDTRTVATKFQVYVLPSLTTLKFPWSAFDPFSRLVDTHTLSWQAGEKAVVLPSTLVSELSAFLAWRRPTEKNFDLMVSHCHQLCRSLNVTADQLRDSILYAPLVAWHEFYKLQDEADLLLRQRYGWWQVARTRAVAAGAAFVVGAAFCAGMFVQYKVVTRLGRAWERFTTKPEPPRRLPPWLDHEFMSSLK